MANQAQQVRITKKFSVSKNELFEAWTAGEKLKHWWKPMDKTLVDVQNEIRKGGRVDYGFDNGLRIHGEYKQVAPGDKLVYSWIWELPEDSHHRGEYLLTVVFKGDEQQSELEVVQENFQNEHSVKPHQEGWETALNDLEKFLQSGR